MLTPSLIVDRATFQQAMVQSRELSQIITKYSTRLDNATPTEICKERGICAPTEYGRNEWMPFLDALTNEHAQFGVCLSPMTCSCRDAILTLTSHIVHGGFFQARNGSWTPAAVTE